MKYMFSVMKTCQSDRLRTDPHVRSEFFLSANRVRNGSTAAHVTLTVFEIIDKMFRCGL